MTRDDLAELRDWYGRAVRDLERPADMTERRQGVPGPDGPPRVVLSGDAAGTYLSAPPAVVRDTGRAGASCATVLVPFGSSRAGAT